MAEERTYPPEEIDLASPGFCLRLRARDELAWEALYEACGFILISTAQRILPPRLDPEAAAQQAWVRAIHRVARLDPKRDPKPWMISICVNVCISVIRRDRVHRRLRLLKLRLGVPDSGEKSPPHGHKIPASRVREGVASLNRNQQQIVYLRFACGMSFPDIADAVGIREATVRKRLSRAYAKLRLLLGDDPELEDPDAMNFPEPPPA